MSLLEDIFLQDEANEAQELERVIEGDEYDERPRSVSPSGDESDGGKREDEAEEDKRRVDPTSTKTTRVIKNPRFLLNPARLTGPRGIQVIPEHYKDFKFKGKGHEKDDVDMVLKKLEHWAYRLYPKFQFQDCLKKIETLGKKRPVMVQLHKIRTDQFLSEETVVQKDSSDDEAQPPQEEDEFDKLLQQQIDLARATPGPGSVKKAVRSDQWERLVETPVRDDRPSAIMPKATSSPSMTDDQKERMLRNRKLAEERRLARLKQSTSSMDNGTTNSTIIEINETVPVTNVKSNVTTNFDDITEVVDENVVSKKNNRSNVIDSSDSDEECNMTAVNEPIVVDIHHNSHTTEDNYSFKLAQDKRNTHEADNDIEEVLIDDEGININDKDNVIKVVPNNDNSNAITERSNNESDIGDKDNDVIGENGYDDKMSDNTVEACNNADCVKENDSVTNDKVDSNEINDNIDNNKDLSNTSENDSVIAQNIVDKDTSKQIEQNTQAVAEDDNMKQKETVEDLTDVMDVDFTDEF